MEFREIYRAGWDPLESVRAPLNPIELYGILRNPGNPMGSFRTPRSSMEAHGILWNWMTCYGIIKKMLETFGILSNPMRTYEILSNRMESNEILRYPMQCSVLDNPMESCGSLRKPMEPVQSYRIIWYRSQTYGIVWAPMECRGIVSNSAISYEMRRNPVKTWMESSRNLQDPAESFGISCKPKASSEIQWDPMMSFGTLWDVVESDGISIGNNGIRWNPTRPFGILWNPWVADQKNKSAILKQNNNQTNETNSSKYLAPPQSPQVGLATLISFVLLLCLVVSSRINSIPPNLRDPHNSFTTVRETLRHTLGATPPNEWLWQTFGHETLRHTFGIVQACDTCTPIEIRKQVVMGRAGLQNIYSWWPLSDPGQTEAPVGLCTYMYIYMCSFFVGGVFDFTRHHTRHFVTRLCETNSLMKKTHSSKFQLDAIWSKDVPSSSDRLHQIPSFLSDAFGTCLFPSDSARTFQRSNSFPQDSFTFHKITLDSIGIH